METSTMPSTRRSPLGPWLRQALAYVILPGLALGAALGCGPGTSTSAPTISSITPLEGLVGTTITVTGSGFSSGIQGAYVNTVPVTPGTINGDTQLLFQVPNAAITGTITVVTTSGSVTSSQAFAVTPDVVTISPTTGPIGQVVTLTGSGFTGATVVTFGGGIPATAFTVDSANTMTATVPAGATTGEIVITASGQSSSDPSSQDYFTVN
jgi:hypothetical protein